VLFDSPSVKAVAIVAIEQEDGNVTEKDPQPERICSWLLLPLPLSSPINLPPRMTSEVVELLANIIPRISANDSLVVVSLWIEQSKNLMLANVLPSRTKILRMLWRILGDHEQFQNARWVVSSSSLFVLRSSNNDRRMEDSELAAWLLASEALFPMRYEEKVYIVEFVVNKLFVNGK